MSVTHPLGIQSKKPEEIEKVDPKFVQEKLLWARDQSWKVYSEIKEELKPGMTENDCRKMALKIFENTQL